MDVLQKTIGTAQKRQSGRQTVDQAIATKAVNPPSGQVRRTGSLGAIPKFQNYIASVGMGCDPLDRTDILRDHPLDRTDSTKVVFTCGTHLGYQTRGITPWHLVDEVYMPMNYSDEFHWVLAVVVLKECRFRVYESMSRKRRFGPSSEIQKLAKILPTYLDMSGFLDQKVRTDWDCGPFIAAYAEYLSDGLQVPNDEIDAVLLRKIYTTLLWKYGEAKAQKPYARDIKDPRRPKPNFVAPNEEQLVHFD
ncbi:hypothetical protein BC332_30914 [Capsicum chinense]|nr:hypothetical protein BC332_30914 [Capsicum chinense]